MSVLDWIAAHWQILALLLLLIVEWWLPRTRSVEARSLIEAIANLLRAVPLVRQLGTPPVELRAEVDRLARYRPSQPGPLLALLVMLSLAAPVRAQEAPPLVPVEEVQVLPAAVELPPVHVPDLTLRLRALAGALHQLQLDLGVPAQPLPPDWWSSPTGRTVAIALIVVAAGVSAVLTVTEGVLLARPP